MHKPVYANTHAGKTVIAMNKIGKSATARDILGHVHTKRENIYAVMRSLERAGLVKRSADHEYGVYLHSLTPKGKELAASFAQNANANNSKPASVNGNVLPPWAQSATIKVSDLPQATEPEKKKLLLTPSIGCVRVALEFMANDLVEGPSENVARVAEAIRALALAYPEAVRNPNK